MSTASKIQRDAERDAALAAAARAETAKLEQLEREAFAAREEHRATAASIKTRFANDDREVADALARDVFADTELSDAIRSWREVPNRATLRTICGRLKAFEERAKHDNGMSLRPVTAAAVFAQILIDERPELLTAYFNRQAFEGSNGLGGHILEASDALVRAAVADDLFGAEDALRQVERGLHGRKPCGEPTDKQRALWLAQVQSSRPSDYEARVSALTPIFRAEEAAEVETSADDHPALADESSSDDEYDRETEGLERAAKKSAYVHDTAHMDQLAAEQLAPRAVQPRT